MGRLLISWFINAVALAVAAYLVPTVIPEGIVVAGEPPWLSVAITALIFGLVNALIRPLLKLVTCSLIALTLGLFTLIINGLMLWLTSWIGQQFDVGFVVNGFLPALLGAFIISIVSFFLSLIFREEGPRGKRRAGRRQDRW